MFPLCFLQALDAAILAAHMSAATGPAATAPRMPSLAQGERGERGERREESGKLATQRGDSLDND